MLSIDFFSRSFLSKKNFLTIVDDLNSEKFALNAGLMGYEGAKQGTKMSGMKEQVAPILFTENALSGISEEKWV